MRSNGIAPDQPPRWRSLASGLIGLAWPIALSMLSYSLMTAVDTLFVGRFGAEAIAAVGLGGLVSFSLLTFGMGLLRGGKIIVAHAVGARREGEVPRFAAATIVVSLVSTVGTWIVTIGVAPLLGFVFHESRANDLIVSYVVIRSTALPMVLVATALRELSQGVGDSRRPMWAAVTANLANIPLNALFVLHLGWGVSGSAWANVLAQAIDLGCLAWQRRTWLGELIRVEWSLVRQIMVRGWPLGAEMFLDVGAFSALGFILARLGAIEMASHQIALQICHLSILPIIALGEAASVLAGQAAGARSLERVPQILRVGILSGVLFSSATGLVLLLVPRSIVGAFTSDVAVQRLAAIVLYPVVGFQVAFSCYCIGKSVLRALGDIRFTATVTVAAAWICTPPLTLLFGHGLGWGVVGGWCALAVEITLASTIYLVRFEHGSWQQHLGDLELPDGSPQPIDENAATAAT
jgi:multidrug resistance protein, MATE family